MRRFRAVDIMTRTQVFFELLAGGLAMSKFEHMLWEDIRRECFSLDPGQLYLNNSSFGATLNSVVKRMREVQQLYSNGAVMDRWLREVVYVKQKQVDSVFGELLNVGTRGVETQGGAIRQVYLVGTVTSVTEGMSLIANGLTLGKRDIILTTDHEHSGGYSMWKLQAHRYCAEVVEVSLLEEADDKNTSTWPEGLIKRFKRKLDEYGDRVKVMSFSWITHSTGHQLPVKELCDLAERYGVVSVVDGAQAFGVIPIDFNEIGADFLVVNGHKYLNGPIGTGFICMRDLTTSDKKHDMNMKLPLWPTIVDEHSEDFDKKIQCKKGGVQPYTNIMPLHQALTFYRDLDPKRVYDRLWQIGDWLRHGLSQYQEFKVITPLSKGQSVSMTCFSVGDKEQTECVFKALKSSDQPWKPIHSFFFEKTGIIRLSPHYYHTAEDLDMLADALCATVGVNRSKWPAFPTEHVSESTAHSVRCGAFHLPADSRHPWPLSIPFQVMSTLTKLVFYGQAPGFHHGLDLRAPAGTPVSTPISGIVKKIGSYYPKAGDYAYEITIEDENGFIWKFHHVDKNTIPSDIEVNATVTAGQHIADLYDPALQELRVPPHLHLEILGPDGYLHDPLNWLPPLEHARAPVLRGIWVIDRYNRIVSSMQDSEQFSGPVSNEEYELLIDIADFIPPVGDGDAVKELKVSLDCRVLRHLRFDRLPYDNYMIGADEVYKIGPVIRADGACLVNFNQVEKPSVHIYRCPLDLRYSTASQCSLSISAKGYGGNLMEEKFLLKIARSGH